MPNLTPEQSGCAATSGEGARPQRADALRNRASVLAAAEAVFAAEGINAPVDVIAEKAGVGVGTLYRHFPTKEKLLEAILLERIVEITQDARSRLASDEPGRAFFGFLEYLVEESTLKRDLILALADAGISFEEAVAGAKQDLEQSVNDLLCAAQRSGAVRSDVTSAVVLSLISATCVAADNHHVGAKPCDMLAIVCDGLRTPSSSR